MRYSFALVLATAALTFSAQEVTESHELSNAAKSAKTPEAEKRQASLLCEDRAGYISVSRGSRR
jgi:hypothetical protein